MMDTDESVLFCTIEIVRLGKPGGVTSCERGIRFDAAGVPIWEHAYGVIGDWLYARGVDNYFPLKNPIFEMNLYWVIHFSGKTARMVRLIPPARSAGAV